MHALIDFYKENAKILKTTFQEMGFAVYGELLLCAVIEGPLRPLGVLHIACVS